VNQEQLHSRQCSGSTRRLRIVARSIGASFAVGSASHSALDFILSRADTLTIRLALNILDCRCSGFKAGIFHGYGNFRDYTIDEVFCTTSLSGVVYYTFYSAKNNSKVCRGILSLPTHTERTPCSPLVLGVSRSRCSPNRSVVDRPGSSGSGATREGAPTADTGISE